MTYLDEKLSPNFTLYEFIHSDVAWSTNELRFAQMAYITDERVKNLKKVAEALQTVRDAIGIPIHINSGLRCPELNSALPGSAPNSKHLDGLAADISCQRVSDLRKYWSLIKKCKLFDHPHCYYKDTTKSAYCHLQILNNG